ncbi:hypothetical protein H2O64_22220 [Kordia sp. YSTF-M3]|uniref:AlgX/AlgJ SGNH hydrolase-like domain-containing protein n=1 Tax=Kordia aestuariivivens TaxID=2759037 RepID=A0ABR7QFR8_9FLAO|nr:hypothetical protein [Kordia aestuariivivens]MBC8757402.1 hypothetical protein [Kordia aestuariivivens]
MKIKCLLILNFLLFTNVYAQNIASSEIILEGEIEFISKLPNPKKMDYPDCNYSTILNIHSDSKDTRISVVFKGVVNRKLVKTAKFKIGDKVKITLIPFEKASSEIRQTQLVDQIDDFDIKVYYAVNATKIKKYSKNINSKDIVTKNKKVETISILPINRKVNRIRKRNIKSEIKRIDKLLNSHGGTWEQWEKDIQDFKAEYAKATEAQESKWVENSFFSAGKAYADSNEGNFVEAMTSFNAYLKQFNIDLIIVRIPFKGEVSGTIFSDKLTDHVVNPYAMKVTSDLLNNGIEVVDILPKLIEERKKYPLMFWYNDFEEKHPGEPVARIVAKEINELLKRYPEYETIPKIKTNLKDTIGVRSGKQYKWPKGNEVFSPDKLISYKTVKDSFGNMIQLEYDKNKSPFLLIGNSFLAYPSIAKGGSIPHYLTHESGFISDVYYRSGGIGLGRLIYKKGKSYLENRRAMIYVALPQSFQGTVPVIPLAASINNDSYKEKEIIKFNKDNWYKHFVFFPTPGNERTFKVEKSGNILASGEVYVKTNVGDIKVALPNDMKLSKNDILKISFEFKSIGYGEIHVNYNGQEKSFLRSNDRKDGFYENVYFKIDKNTKSNEFTISFREVKRKQLIKEISVSILAPK